MAACDAEEEFWSLRTTAARLPDWMVKEKPTVVADEDLPMDWVPLPVGWWGLR